MAIRTYLLSYPEIFSLGAELGDVVNQLGLAYIAAWIFHWLVVELPRQRQQRDAYQSAGPLLLQIGISGWMILDLLYQQAGKAAPKDVPDRNTLEEVLSRIDPSRETIFSFSYEKLDHDINAIALL
ncbi:MAG: hypothetical protein LC808_10045, partial [Actinobacteria bacterium]|nr:hypothetical protein [Actinomycetota bacterium]